jgi:hypothetical protein
VVYKWYIYQIPLCHLGAKTIVNAPFTAIIKKHTVGHGNFGVWGIERTEHRRVRPRRLVPGGNANRRRRGNRRTVARRHPHAAKLSNLLHQIAHERCAGCCLGGGEIEECEVVERLIVT